MLDGIHELMPAGSNGWDEVAAKFNAGRYQLKFYTVRNHAKPTGDPSCPVDVVRAKYISRRIDANCAVLTIEDDKDDMDDDGYGDGNSDGNDYASEQDECQVEMNEIEAGHIGAPSGGMTLYVAKKHQSIDKFIDGAMVSDAKDSSDMMSMMLLMDERAAQREEKHSTKSSNGGCSNKSVRKESSEIDLNAMHDAMKCSSCCSPSFCPGRHSGGYPSKSPCFNGVTIRPNARPPTGKAESDANFIPGARAIMAAQMIVPSSPKQSTPETKTSCRRARSKARQ
ncbi:hypothetical protein H257_12815 [Aphanomyces astaci]|uniref:DUF6818 domain-containing protein n=1 Tax=Aphanomyces astaci TaxID=112090 RepID=W4FZA7_APHAT|nr:hypothetical protein H257_12815 [Aphanomyces astaci]ETV72008.1 hypothetical protein H257_12815 [Aphanomyces astaci]|eukprot:XP_009838451.1 hypothetical protein H257_12815 [Aphanomyces astaci]